MTSTVAGHAIKTVLAILSLLVLPWVLILGMAALGTYLQGHFTGPPGRAQPEMKRPRAA